MGFDLLQFLRDPAWGALEAIGTIFAASVALILAYRAITQDRRNRPEISIELIKKDSLIIGKITNNGPRTALRPHIRLKNLIIDNEKLLDQEERAAGVISLPNIQNGQTETKRLFELFQTSIKVLNITAPQLPQNKEFLYEITITGDNFLAKDFKYKYDPSQEFFRKIR